MKHRHLGRYKCRTPKGRIIYKKRPIHKKGLFGFGEDKPSLVQSIITDSKKLEELQPLIDQGNLPAKKEERKIKVRLSEKLETKQILDEAKLATGG